MKLQIRRYEGPGFKTWCLTDNRGRLLPAQGKCDLYHEQDKLLEYGNELDEQTIKKDPDSLTAVVTFIVADENEICFKDTYFKVINGSKIDDWLGPLTLNIRQHNAPNFCRQFVLTDSKGNQLPDQVYTCYKSSFDNISKFVVTFKVGNGIEVLDEMVVEEEG